MMNLKRLRKAVCSSKFYKKNTIGDNQVDFKHTVP